jgi:hypothetical protein
MNNLIGTTGLTAKGEFDSRKELLPELAACGQDIYDGLYLNGSQHLVDASIMAAKHVGQKSAYGDLFKSDDAISVGNATLSQGKQVAEELFLVTEIQLRFAIAAGSTPAQIAAAKYNIIHNLMRNGVIEISQDKRTILPEGTSMDIFHCADHYVASGDNNVAAGTKAVYEMEGFGNIGRIKLANSKFIVPDKKIDVDMEFAGALPENSAIRIDFYGCKNVRG